MRKKIITLLFTVVMLPSLVCAAYANEGYPVHSQQSLPEMIIALLKGDDAVVMLDCDPKNGTVDYVSWVSYDYLSELSTKWKSAGVIVYNSEMDAFFIRVSYIPTISTSGDTYEYCTLGTTNGYVYGAESNTYDAGTTIVIIEDIAGRLEAIYDKLDDIYDRVYDIYGAASQTNSWLKTMTEIIGNIDDSLNDSSFPLLTKLNAIETAIKNINISTTVEAYDDTLLMNRLDAIKTAIENISISADNLTVEAYDDTSLMSKLGLIYDAIIDIDYSMNNTVKGTLYKQLKSIDSSISSLGDQYNTEFTSLFERLDTIKGLLTYSNQETPATIYDWLERRISPTLVSLYGEATDIGFGIDHLNDSINTLNSSIGFYGQRSVTVWLSIIYSELSGIHSALGNLSLTADNITVDAYDDTNVIAAVNAVENTLSNLSFSGEVNTDITPIIEGIGEVNASLNANVGALVDKLDVLVDYSSESVENLTVDISVDNDAYNVFYVTDEDGNEESLVDFSGDVLKAGGKLLNFLFKVCFDGAIENLDGSIDDMDSFYFDSAELGGGLWE